MQNLEKNFPPSFFADTDVNPILRSSEQKILILDMKDPKNKEIYATFYDDISNYLSKLPDGLVKNMLKISRIKI